MEEKRSFPEICWYHSCKKMRNSNVHMLKRIFSLSLAVASLFMLFDCKKDKNNPVSSTSGSPKKETPAKEEKQKPDIKFSEFIFPKDKKDSAMAVFNDQFSEQERYTILALNRLDAKNKWRADTLMIPEKIDATLMSYSPFPFQSDVLKDVKKFVIFSYPLQAYGVYSNGELVKWGPTSMGKKSAQTKRGLMFANWKKELAISTVKSEWKLPYNFNIHNTLGIGWHQYDLPAFPASHSCLRLLMDDAKWLFGYADQWILNKGGATVRANGTPVIVFGDYAWGKKKPWKNLSKNAKDNDISESQLNDIVAPHLQKILGEQQKRAEVLQQIENEKSETKPSQTAA